MLHVFNLTVLPFLQFSQYKINDSGKKVVMLVVCFRKIEPLFEKKLNSLAI